VLNNEFFILDTRGNFSKDQLMLKSLPFLSPIFRVLSDGFPDRRMACMSVGSVECALSGELFLPTS